MTHQMTLFCDQARCNNHIEHDPEQLIELPAGWGEVDFGSGRNGHFCSVSHALDWLGAHVDDDGNWIDVVTLPEEEVRRTDMRVYPRS